MKSKYLFLAMATATMVACTNDDFTQESSIIGHDNLGELINAPIMGVGLESDAITKAIDEKGKFLWDPTTEGEGQSAKVTKTENIGLCWTGVGSSKYPGPATETGDNVYTNIKFDHVGWMFASAKNENPKLHCGVLENGAFHNWNSQLEPQAAYFNGAWAPKIPGETFDYERGLFKSNNGTIYTGEYIVYFPYSDSFWNAPVTAEQDRILTLGLTQSGGDYVVANSTQLVNENSFNVGYVNSINGGDEACAFTTRMLTSGIKLSVKGEANIKEIVLLSQGEKAFITKMALSASEIKKCRTTGSGDLSKDIYMLQDKNNEYASTLVVKTHDGGNCLKVNGTTQTIYIPFLPNTFNNLKVLVVNNEGKVAEIGFDSAMEFTPNKFRPLSLYFNSNGKVHKGESATAPVAGTFTAKNYAYDEESFIDAFTKARTNAANATEAPRTVQLLDNITLTEHKANPYYTTSANPVIVNSDEDLNGEKNLLTLGGIENGNKDYMFRDVVFDADIENEPQGCCNKGKASLTLIDATTAEGTELNLYGTKLNLYSQNVVFNGNVYSKFEPTDEEGELHPNRVPEIQLLKNNGTVVAKGEFLNEGKMDIALQTKFSLEGGQLINGSDADYRASITVNGKGNVGEDGVLLMSKGATFTNHGDIYNKGNIDNDSEAGTFTNEADATFTDYVGSTLSGHRIINKENAEFICEVNSLVRYNNAIDLKGIRPTTILRFVYGDNANIGNGDFIKEYTLQPNKDNGIYVPYNESKLMKFESAIDATTDNKANTLKINAAINQDNEVIATTIGSFTIKSGRVDLYHARLTIDGNYTVDGGHHTYFGENLTVTGNVKFENVIDAKNTESSLTGEVNLKEGKILTVGKDIIVNKVTTLTFKNGSQVIAKNMTVKKDQKVTFEKNNVTKLGEKDPENGVLENWGEITIVNAVTGSDVAAKVWCNRREGKGIYVNNSYPQYW